MVLTPGQHPGWICWATAMATLYPYAPVAASACRHLLQDQVFLGCPEGSWAPERAGWALPSRATCCAGRTAPAGHRLLRTRTMPPPHGHRPSRPSFWPSSSPSWAPWPRPWPPSQEVPPAPLNMLLSGSSACTLSGSASRWTVRRWTRLSGNCHETALCDYSVAFHGIRRFNGHAVGSPINPCLADAHLCFLGSQVLKGIVQPSLHHGQRKVYKEQQGIVPWSVPCTTAALPSASNTFPGDALGERRL